MQSIEVVGLPNFIEAQKCLLPYVVSGKYWQL